MRRLLAIAAFFIFIGCTKDDPVQSASSGSFQYMAYDTNGTPVVSGWMTIDIQDSAHVTGEWHFNKLNNLPNIGPQIGEGNLVGLFNNGQLHVNLNPDYIDNNVFLTGKIQTTTYSGTWIWSGFPGLLNQGNFTAARY